MGDAQFTGDCATTTAPVPGLVCTSVLTVAAFCQAEQCSCQNWPRYYWIHFTPSQESGLMIGGQATSITKLAGWKQQSSKVPFHQRHEFWAEAQQHGWWKNTFGKNSENLGIFKKWLSRQLQSRSSTSESPTLAVCRLHGISSTVPC